MNQTNALKLADLSSRYNALLYKCAHLENDSIELYAKYKHELWIVQEKLKKLTRSLKNEK